MPWPTRYAARRPLVPSAVSPCSVMIPSRFSWTARFGRLHALVARYRCPACKTECRPLLDLLGVEPGRISGSLARLLAVLAVIAPYTQAAQLAWLLLSVKVTPMGVW